MFYTKDTPYFNPDKEVIRLEISVNKEHYPNFPNELYVSEFNFDHAIQKLMGLDYDIKRKLNLTDDEYGKTWIAFGVKAIHTTDPKFFGINGNTFIFSWQ